MNRYRVRVAGLLDSPGAVIPSRKMLHSMSCPWEAILFDLDGTLIDSYAALTKSINFAREQYGLEGLSGDLIRQNVGDGVEILLERTFAPAAVPDTARAFFEAHYDRICCEESRILDHVEPTLRMLNDRGLAMAVCTNKPTAYSSKILESLGLAVYFGAVVGPDLAGSRKPAGAHVLYTLERLGRPPHAALFVGDMPIDVQAARNAGLQVAVVATGSATPEALRSAGPDYFLQSFAQLIELTAGGGSHS